MNGPTANHEDHEVTKFTKDIWLDFFVRLVIVEVGRRRVYMSKTRERCRHL